MARPIRGQVLSLREKEFVEAARAQGAGPLRIMFTEILPNLSSTILVFFTLLIANAILLESALSFLGAGVQPPNPSWGTMIDEGVDRIATAPHLTIVPGPDARADGAVAERLRRRRARRARPARQGAPGALGAGMGRFIVRRIIQMMFVMFAVSVLTFLIFNVIPNGDPADADGRQAATRASRDRGDPRGVGLRRPVCVQYVTTMKKVFTGDLISVHHAAARRATRSRRGSRGRSRSRFGAAILWMFVAICFGLYSAIRAGKFADRFLTIIALIGISMPVFWIGALMNYYLGLQARLVPERRVRGVHARTRSTGSTT